MLKLSRHVMHMNVLLLSRYTDWSSSRLRYHQYIPYLRRRSIDVTPAPLFGAYYLDAIFAGLHPPASRLVRDYLGRILHLLEARKFDLIWLQCEVFPWLPTPLEAALRAMCRPYVVDYDDAWFHHYDQHRNPIVRRLFKHKTAWLMRMPPRQSPETATWRLMAALQLLAAWMFFPRSSIWMS